ncbi:hypothetical protein [Giesbergeria anulus]|uniref:Uncharacterized protein n=1 Tax=Giesbergeria anulus TaxID=180197 RepID=A0A1H9SQW3_9BURK|nr:hypothetical protein [Giesbergeria anulus]SER87331.1 hypothetical protein SAMN02982919_03203 [Giesbergeria anulus]
MDYSTLEKMPGSYNITDDLRHRADNVVWRVKVRPEWVYLYTLNCRFVDGYAHDKLCRPLLYQDLIQAKQVLP